jgi:pimeloyl-ACP methyl ester carboxylesterase
MYPISSLLLVIYAFSFVSVVTSSSKVVSVKASRKFHRFPSKFGEYNVGFLEFLPQFRVDDYLPWRRKEKASVLCLHGFGGNADQWRKNLPVLSQAGYRSYAMDLLGYGYSDKPSPKAYGVNEIYNFDTW